MDGLMKEFGKENGINVCVHGDVCFRIIFLILYLYHLSKGWLFTIQNVKIWTQQI